MSAIGSAIAITCAKFGLKIEKNDRKSGYA